MKIKFLSDLKTILSNPNSHHNYFAWPSLVRLKNGNIAVASSGFRLKHICPFGKSVIAFSKEEGKTYSAPTPIIDTVLDDRDAGLCPFGDSGLILTSFNTTVELQRICAENNPYVLAYLDQITPEEEAHYLGATFKISFDKGKTSSKPQVLYQDNLSSDIGYPATVELKDGSLITVFYLHDGQSQPAVIKQQKWTFTN